MTQNFRNGSSRFDTEDDRGHLSIPDLSLHFEKRQEQVLFLNSSSSVTNGTRELVRKKTSFSSS